MIVMKEMSVPSTAEHSFRWQFTLSLAFALGIIRGSHLIPSISESFDGREEESSLMDELTRFCTSQK